MLAPLARASVELTHRVSKNKVQTTREERADNIPADSAFIIEWYRNLLLSNLDIGYFIFIPYISLYHNMFYQTNNLDFHIIRGTYLRTI